ncbi:MAG: hypothetical protein ACK559_23900, partial [bacterium]
MSRRASVRKVCERCSRVPTGGNSCGLTSHRAEDVAPIGNGWAVGCRPPTVLSYSRRPVAPTLHRDPHGTVVGRVFGVVFSGLMAQSRY